nr:MAG TPA: major prion protein [Caudoviricetes sp.]
MVVNNSFNTFYLLFFHCRRNLRGGIVLFVATW